MTKKEICINNKSVAYYSGFFGLEIKHIEYGIDDYVIYKYTDGNTVYSYHKSVIKYTASGKTYFVWNNRRIPLNECIRTNY